ncbi:MAG: PAS domain S-box protein, partial [Proteocatella sp.]
MMGNSNLKFSEEQYKDFVDNASDLIQCVGIDGEFLYVNRVWREKLGYIGDEISSMTLWDVIHPDSRAHCRDVFRKIIAGDKVDLIEAVFVTKDRQNIYAKGNVNCRFDESGGFISTRGIFRDISMEKAKELEILKYKKLADEKAKMQEMLSKAIADFIDIDNKTFSYIINHTLEKFGKYVSADRTYVFEYNFDEGICKNTHEWCNQGIESQISNLQNLPLEIIANWISLHTVEKMVHIPDIFALPENDEARILLQKQKIKSLIIFPMVRDGECYGFVGFDSVKDHHFYTENEQEILFELGSILLSALLRMKTTNALSESEASKTALIKSIQDLVFVLDFNLIYRECYSPESDLLYVPPELVIGKHVDDIEFPEPALGIMKMGMEKVIKLGEAERVEYYLDLPKGRFWFDAQITATSVESDIDIRIVCTIRDITKRVDMESVLRHSEENFRVFFETMDDLVFVGNQQGEICFTNSTASEKLGYSSEELKNMNMLDFHPKNKQNESREILDNASYGRTNICPFPLITKNGECFPVETRIWLGRWDGQKCVFAVSKDLSKEQEALQKFNRLFDNNPALMAVSTVDERTLSEVNNAFLQILGYSKDEVIGKTSKELNIFCENDKLDNFSEELKRNGKISNFELKVQCRDGQILYGLFFGETIESQGKKYFLTVMTDITYRKKAEVDLYNEVENRRILLDNIHTQVWYLRNKYTYGSVNEAHASFSGFKKEDIAFKNMYDIFPEEVADRCKIANEKVFKGEKTYSEKWLPHFSGEKRLIAVSKSPVFEADGTVAYAVCSGEDITERKQMEDEIYIEKELFKTTLLSVGDGVISTDNNGKITVMNRVAENLTGWDKDDALGRPFEDVFKILYEDSRSICENPVQQVLKTRAVMEQGGNTVLVSKLGKEISIEESSSPIKDSNGSITGVVTVFKDFTDKKEKQKQIEYLSYNDYLTGL